MSDAWRDITMHSRGATDRTPRVWELQVGKLRIYVHRHVHHPQDVWLLSCAPWFDNTEIGRDDADTAKYLAESMVRAALRAAMARLEAARD